MTITLNIHKKHLLVGLVCLLTGILLTLAVVNKASVTYTLRAWKLFPGKNKVTELYFTNIKHQPESYIAGDLQRVEFTIKNIGNATGKYTYTITQSNEDGTKTTQLAKAEITLEKGHIKDFVAPITVIEAGAKSKITIELNTGERIEYWLNRINT